MSIIKPEVLTYVGSHSQVRYSVPKSDSTHVCVKSEGFTPSQPSIVRFRCEYCPQDFCLKQYLVEHVDNAHGSLFKPFKAEKFQSHPSIMKPVNPDFDAYEHSTAILGDTEINEPRTSSSKHTFECGVCHK
eukprot:248642_1